MCEKNFEGKIMSPPSDGDIDETIPSDWKPVKKTKKKKSKNSSVMKKSKGGSVMRMSKKKDIGM